MASPCPAVVIGAGPAGLATAASLKRRGIEPTVLEAGASLGTSWRNHYRRLHLHTVKAHSSLPGLPFPDDVPRYPSRADVIAYLEAYAARFGIAPRMNQPVWRISAVNGTLAVESASGLYHSTVVVVAAGINRIPNPDRLPDQSVFQGTVVHAGAYQDGSSYAGQRVLVVGAGNTGAEVALDLAEHGARPTLSVRTPVNVVARDFLGVPAQVTGLRTHWIPIPIGDRLGRLISRLAFGDLTRYGLPRPELGPLSSIARRGRIPIIDVGTIDAIKRGRIAVKPAVARLTSNGAVFDDGTEAIFDAVVMATGYRPGLTDIVDIPGVLDADGYPTNWKADGTSRGLYFVGYRNVATGLLREIGLQAEAVADDMATNMRPPGTD
jgi:cation diffusion facilitator CzcD-associated flavoprotein CzcO